MSDGTGISWATTSWNAVTGCDRVSRGCDNCYALTLAARLHAMGNPRYQVDGDPRTSGPGFGVTMHWDKLEEPFHWRRPRRIFVNSMSDLWHPKVTDEFVAAMFDVMERCTQHQFLILTKRPRRMRAWIRKNRPEPLPDVWLGVSAEDQQAADDRMPRLLDTPAAVRFVSAEPLLGPLDLTRLNRRGSQSLDCLRGRFGSPAAWHPAPGTVDWVIVGGESGAGYRPMDLDWARSLRDQCHAAGVAFYYKQGSGIRPEMDRTLDGEMWEQFPVSQQNPRPRSDSCSPIRGFTTSS